MPLVVSRLDDCKIYKIADRKVYNFPVQNGRDANYILKGMEVHYHTSDEKVKLESYFSLIDQGLGHTVEACTLRQELEEMLGKDHSELKRADMLLSFF